MKSSRTLGTAHHRRSKKWHWIIFRECQLLCVVNKLTEEFRIAQFQKLLSHSRFLITLRSSEGVYHNLILFRLSTDDEKHVHGGAEQTTSTQRAQLYAMEAQCPHLGADISHADIEECEDSLVLVCPWHRCAPEHSCRVCFQANVTALMSPYRKIRL